MLDSFAEPGAVASGEDLSLPNGMKNPEIIAPWSQAPF